MSEIMDGYIRVSRVQGREGDSYISPSVQREAIERWAEYKSITIGEWLIDEDQSGGTHDRPALKRGIERALGGETTGIVAWKIDRFSRTTEGGLKDLRRLQDADARLAFVVEDIDTATVYGKMVYTILLAVSEAFLENVKAGWRGAKARATERGAKVGHTPLGYTRGDGGKLVLDPVMAPVVAQAFQLAAGRGLSAAMAHLEEHVTDRRWTTTTVRRVLSQRAYLGEMTFDGVTYPDTHEAIIKKRSVWIAAQSAPATRAGHADFPLSGVLTCACGAPMVGGRGGKGQRVYRCAASLSGWTGERCPTGCVVTADRVETYALTTAQDLVAGRTARIVDARAQAPDLDALDLAEREARGELDAFASDLTLRRVLGDTYHAHLLEREGAVLAASEAYRDACRIAEGEQVTYTADDLADDPATVGVFLSGLFEIRVRPGRGLKIGDRVRFVPLDGDGAIRVARA
jgi:DNA invertase Pin-like site-specific DNA recombinase